MDLDKACFSLLIVSLAILNEDTLFLHISNILFGGTVFDVEFSHQNLTELLVRKTCCRAKSITNDSEELVTLTGILSQRATQRDMDTTQ